MISEYREFKLSDKVKMIVNWNGSEDVKECKKIQFVIGDKGKEQSFYIEREELVNFMLLMGTEQNANDLIPETITKVTRYETILEFKWKASRNVKKDEVVLIRAPHIVNLPVSQEVFRGSLKQNTTLGGIIRPNKPTLIERR
jgi:hypothetical protein